MKRILLLLITITLVFTTAACNSSGGDSARVAEINDFLGDVTAVSGGEDLPAFKGLTLLRQELSRGRFS